jgi:hypothetical protein
MNLEILESTDYVVRRAEHVAILSEGIEAFAKLIARRKFSHWLEMSPLDIRSLGLEVAVPFLFVLNSTSFCYWGMPKWRVYYDQKFLDGTWALVATLGRALEKGTPICSSRFLATLSTRQFDNITNGNTSIPLVKERSAILNEVGRVVTACYQGRFIALLDSVDYDAVNFVGELVKKLPNFEDVRSYRGRTVYFRKRAQLLAADLGFLLARSYPSGKRRMQNIGALTACADYKLPQVLRRHGILKYSASLSDAVERGSEIPAGCPKEVEIRAATIWAVEGIRTSLTKDWPTITSSEINNLIWLMGQEHPPDDHPYHRTVTTAY